MKLQVGIDGKTYEVEVEVVVVFVAVVDEVVVAAGVGDTAVPVEATVVLSPPEEGIGSATTTITATEVVTIATIPTNLSDALIFFIGRRLYLNIVPITES